MRFFALLGSPVMSEMTSDWFNKAQTLSDGEKFSDPQKAVALFLKIIPFLQ